MVRAGVAKRKFLIDLGSEKVEVEGYDPRKALIKYLMKRRRSMLMTKDEEKLKRLWDGAPKSARVQGARLEKRYRITWKLKGEGELAGARYVFEVQEE